MRTRANRGGACSFLIMALAAAFLIDAAGSMRSLVQGKRTASIARALHPAERPLTES